MNNQLYVIRFNETQVILEASSQQNAPTVEEFKKDYNFAYDLVSANVDIVEEKDEFEEIIKLLIATHKYRQPTYTAIIAIDGSLDSVDDIENNIITPSDDETPGFTMEELNDLEKEFKE